jgi:hypothetical protein
MDRQTSPMTAERWMQLKKTCKATTQGAHTCGMSEDKKFCPNCKAMTMEPAKGVAITPEELNQMEPGPPVFEGHLTPYQCPVCLHFAYIPVF